MNDAMTEILLTTSIFVFSVIAVWGIRRLKDQDERITRLERKMIWK